MKITAEKLRHWAEMASLTSEGVSCLSAEQLTQIADHIDAQAARISELESALNIASASFANERIIAEKLSARLEQAEKELAAIREQEIEINNDMALAFHHAISDGALGSDDIEEIKTGLRAAFSHINQSPLAVLDNDTLREMVRAWNRARFPAEAYPAMREVLRLNSGSKPFVVKLSGCVDDLHGIGPVMSAEKVVKAIKAAGGSVEDE